MLFFLYDYKYYLEMKETYRQGMDFVGMVWHPVPDPGLDGARIRHR